MRLRVECAIGHRGEETPRRFALGSRTVHVVEVIDRWLAPERGYFKVLGDDQDIYILRHDATAGGWYLTMFADGGAWNRHPTDHPGPWSEPTASRRRRTCSSRH